jgi:hypothetical protein
MTKQAKVYRQGDVWIYEIHMQEYLEGVTRSVSARVVADPEKGMILAEGEATGHHHRIVEATRVALRPSRENGLVRFLEVSKGDPVSLVHEEHETISLPPGHYEVRIQREYSPAERSKQTYVRD